MINILIPTDFSELSKVAIRYAIRFANKIDGNITLLSVLTMPQASRASIRFKLRSLEQEITNMTQEDLQALVDEFGPLLKTKDPLKVRIIRGTSFNDAVVKEAKRLRSGMIIMSTRGASGIKKYIMGSNTAAVITVSHIPVLVIPELGQFKNFRNVVYATDLKHLEKELKTLIPYLEKFESIVHLVHVTNSLKQVPALEKKIDAIVSKSGFKNVIVRVMVNPKPDEALEHYVSTVKADLITTFTHQHSFYDRLFHRSLTRKMAFQSKIPLLAFKQL
jgi:nucleotide-binding universal stress UspA family protein